MLDINLSAAVSDQVWNSLPFCASLPNEESIETYFAIDNTIPRALDTERRFHRIQFRSRAIVHYDNFLNGVYTFDISPMGLGFYSPVQLFPKQKMQLRFYDLPSMSLEVKRCHRAGSDCYACGSKFSSGELSPAQYKNIFACLDSL